MKSRSCLNDDGVEGALNQPAIKGRKTRAMNEDLRLVVPDQPFFPVYRVTGDWETLVESRQALEWGKAVALGLLGALIGGVSGGSSDLVQALHVMLFCLLGMLTLAALDAIWVARHAAELELVDRASSGLDEWRSDRIQQRSTATVLLGALLSWGAGICALGYAFRPESWLNPWIAVPLALVLIALPIKSVVRKLGSDRRLSS